MIYFDHAAATPVDSRVLEAMMPYFGKDFFNPSAAYLPAKKVASDYDKAKSVIAHAIGAKTSDLVITAGATEANNLAFTSMSGKALFLATEHDSVRRVAESYGGAAIKVLSNGLIDLLDLKAKLDDEVQRARKQKAHSILLGRFGAKCVPRTKEIIWYHLQYKTDAKGYIVQRGILGGLPQTPHRSHKEERLYYSTR